jgi:hypothetical protein
MGHAAGPRNRWSCGSGWKLSFYSLFLLPKGGDVSLVPTDIFWEGEVSPWLVITFWDLLQSTLHTWLICIFFEFIQVLVHILFNFCPT